MFNQACLTVISNPLNRYQDAKHMNFFCMDFSPVKDLTIVTHAVHFGMQWLMSSTCYTTLEP